MSKWISVHDMTPPEDESVMVYPYNYDGTEDFSVTGVYFDGVWTCEHSNEIKPTHWQPLLKGPEVDS